MRRILAAADREPGVHQGLLGVVMHRCSESGGIDLARARRDETPRAGDATA